MAATVEDLQVFLKAKGAARAVSALLTRPSLKQDRDLAGQLNRASIRVVSDIAEGFGQKTDRHFARYLYDARGGAAEIQVQLAIAFDRGYLGDDERAQVVEMFAEVARMLTGLIRHLERDNWTDRRR